MSETFLTQLKTFDSDLKLLRREVKSVNVPQIARKFIRHRAEKLGTKWFSALVSNHELAAEIRSDVIERYSKDFRKLIQLSSPNNLKSSYLEILNRVAKTFRQDIIVPVQTGGGSPGSFSQLNKLLSGIESPTRSEYLTEAVSCASHGLFRGAAVLGWCAAIDQIHSAIQRVGFTKFNVTSAAMASQQKGRYKRFKQVQNVASLNELREVFDTTVLWVLEGMQLIDNNQHTRLRSCFELRCQCAHPGEAPITEFNLLSFFSDLDAIVFENPSLAP